MPNFTLEATLPVSFDEALTRLKAAAAAEGFGVLYELDFSGIIAAKTGSTLPGGRVTGLGLCDPRLARDALTLDPALAALLPCGAFVAETPQGARVGILDPDAALALPGRPELTPLGQQARERLARAIAGL